MMTLKDQIRNIFRGDTLTIFFPEGFELSYIRRPFNKPEEKISFICEYLDVYYWDEEDHRCKDLYFYEANPNNNPFHGWTCKKHSLTPESLKKLDGYLSNNYITDARKNK